MITNAPAATAKDTVISPDYLVWKFCGKSAGKYVKLRYFSQAAFKDFKIILTMSFIIFTQRQTALQKGLEKLHLLNSRTEPKQ